MTRRSGHYTPRTGSLICEQIALGKTLNEALKIVGYLAPSIPTFWRWIDEHDDFRERYERARMLQADTHADRMLEMAAEVVAKPSAAAAYRVACDILKWQASIRNRRVYGDKSTEEAKKPMNAAEIKKEITRLENELGIKAPASTTATAAKKTG